MSWSGLLGVKYNHMLKVKGNLVYDFTQKIEIKLLKSATSCNRAKFPSYAYELETPWLVSIYVKLQLWRYVQHYTSTL